MADQFQIPQASRNPPQGQPIVPPYDLINQYLNRQAQVPQMLPDAINQAAEWNLNQQKLKAQAFEAGGPYLMNQLYGGGQQSQQQPPAQMPQVGAQPQQPTGDSDTNPNPTTPPNQGQTQGAVGSPSQTNGNSSAQPSAQTPPSQPQWQPGQPLMHPTSGLPQTIHDHLANNGIIQPDAQAQYLAALGLQPRQAGQLGAMGKFGTSALQGLKTVGDLQQQPLAAQKMQNDIAMQPTEAAIKQQQLANEQQQIPQANKKTIAEEVSKQGADSQQIRDLQTLASNLHQSIGKDLGMGGNLKGSLYQATGGRFGSSDAAAMQNATIPLATGLNTVLSHRFNAGEVAALGQSLIPQPKDTPQYQQQKLQNLNKLLNVMASGNEQNVRNVASAITSGAIPKVGIPSSQNSAVPQKGQVYKGYVFLGGDPSQQSSWKKQ
jgi:hypothetical protein